jgi:cell division septation protein DedD
VAPAPVVAAAPTPKKSVASVDGDYLVQLGAVRSADAADKEWSRIQKANAEFLSGLKPDIVKVEIPDKGTFWRIRAGTMSEQSARQLCQQLSAHSQGCILVRK